MNFQQTIFLNNASSSSSSKAKTQNASKQSGNADFYKIMQNLSSSLKDNGGGKINSSGTKTESTQMSSDTDYNAKMSDMDDLIDENVINQALGVKSTDTQTEKTNVETKFSAKDVKALIFDRQMLEEISAELNIPMEIIEAFISQIVLQTMGDETMIPAIVDFAITQDKSMGLAGLGIAPAEEFGGEIDNEDFKSEFIERLKQFVEMDENDRTAQKYSDLNEFVDAVKNGLDLNEAAKIAVRQNHLLNRFLTHGNATEVTDETTEFVTEKILEYLNIEADSLSDFEIVSIEKFLNENAPENDGFPALLQKLRNPFAAMAHLHEVNTDAVGVTAEKPVDMETSELIPVISTAETENNTDETEVAEVTEGYKPATVSEDDLVNIGAFTENISDSVTGIKQYPDVITHYTRSVNSIQNLIMNNKSGENFQVKMLLRPEGLGEMLVRVTYNKGDINLNITTDNALAQKELISQSTELRNTLSEQNFNLMNFDIGNKNPDDRNQYGGEENGRKNRNRAGKINGMNIDAENSSKISTEDIIRLRSIYQNRTVYKQI